MVGSHFGTDSARVFMFEAVGGVTVPSGSHAGRKKAMLKVEFGK